VRWKYVVENTGNIDLSEVTVEDVTLLVGGSPPPGGHTNPVPGECVAAGVPGPPDSPPIGTPKPLPTTLVVGEVMECFAEGVVVEGQYENKATAKGDTGLPAPLEQVMDMDPSHHFGIDAPPPPPVIDIEKFTQDVDGVFHDADEPCLDPVTGPFPCWMPGDAPSGPELPANGPVNWKYVVTNVSFVPMIDVTVEDVALLVGGVVPPGSHTNPVPGDCIAAGPGPPISPPVGTSKPLPTTLAGGEVMECFAQGVVVAGQYENKATTTGVGATPPMLQAMDMDPSHHFGEEQVCEVEIEKFCIVGQGVRQEECKIQEPGEPVCDKEGTMTFRYTGGGCTASDNSQGDKADCSGAINPALPITVTAGKKAKNGGGIDPGKTYTVIPSTVEPDAPGWEFVVSRPGGKFEADSLFVLSQNGASEENRIHTSCSQNLDVGDVFGSLTLVAFNGDTGGGSTVTYEYDVTNVGDPAVLSVEDDQIGQILPPTEFATGEMMTIARDQEILVETHNEATVSASLVADETATCDATDTVWVTVEVPSETCEDGKAAVLTMRYMDNNNTSHTQDPSKVQVDGDPGNATPVYIIASSKENLNDDKNRIWFEGEVDQLDTFDIDAANANRSKLDAATFVRILDGQDGNELQFLEFHTSCSQDLNVGDQFGSLLLEVFQAED
jgi:hypothetical protein